MGSRLGGSVSLPLFALPTTSFPAVPDARQTRPEHRRRADFDIRDRIAARVDRSLVQYLPGSTETGARFLAEW